MTALLSKKLCWPFFIHRSEECSLSVNSIIQHRVRHTLSFTYRINSPTRTSLNPRKYTTKYSTDLPNRPQHVRPLQQSQRHQRLRSGQQHKQPPERNDLTEGRRRGINRQPGHNRIEPQPRRQVRRQPPNHPHDPSTQQRLRPRLPHLP